VDERLREEVYVSILDWLRDDEIPPSIAEISKVVGMSYDITKRHIKNLVGEDLVLLTRNNRNKPYRVTLPD
jgi:predicted transcriptional regulator